MARLYETLGKLSSADRSVKDIVHFCVIIQINEDPGSDHPAQQENDITVHSVLNLRLPAHVCWTTSPAWRTEEPDEDILRSPQCLYCPTERASVWDRRAQDSYKSFYATKPRQESQLEVSHLLEKQQFVETSPRRPDLLP